MEERQTGAPARQLTARGAATRARIVEAASDLIRVKGVAGTTFEEIKTASGTSKSQLYRHFPDKESLVQAVIAFRGADRIDFHGQELGRVRTIRGLERWRDVIVARVAAVRGAGGCELGSIANEIADQDGPARVALGEQFRAWDRLLRESIERLRQDGVLRADADPERLAMGIMAALQGGYLLSRTERSEEPMKVALNMAIDHVRSFETPNQGALSTAQTR